MTTMTSPAATPPALEPLFRAVADRAREANVFGEVAVTGRGVVCEAKESAAPAQYRLTWEKGRLYAEVTTADRWLSHSIEADLLNTGDKLEELVDEELVELGGTALHAKVEHFRNDEKLFVFRSALPIASDALGGPGALTDASRALLAYEACFSKLGDMSAGAGED